MENKVNTDLYGSDTMKDSLFKLKDTFGKDGPSAITPNLFGHRYDNHICPDCGQLHEINGTHLYDYSAQVDEDLVCYICLQPLVVPVDTKCGHTYCSSCLRNFLKVQKICPVDRQHLTWRDCNEASIMVKRLLDKLLVVCPNVDYCEEVLPRCELQSHLKNRCKGAVVKCGKEKFGCQHHGPRSALDSHMLYECTYRNVASNDSDDGMPKNPIVEGEITTIDIQRGCYDLGISIVGGTDTPLMCVVVQDLLHDGIAAKDGRLQSGDQILEVNGEDLTQATHTQARKALELLYSICRLTVYREKSEDNSPIEKEEILRISLVKQKGKQLGIKLVGKRHSPGLYIMDVIPESLAAQDNRLKRDDRILEINCQDLTFGTQEQAANIIQASVDKVQFVVSRRSRPQTPDLIRSTSHEQISGSLADDGALCKQCEEKHFTVAKDSKESLGISVAGGLESLRGDIPLYVTNIQANGCLGRSKQIKKGDVLLAINGTSLKSLTHKEAVKALKASADAKSVTLRTISSVESSDGITNFSPSWLYWLNLPKKCQIEKTITIQKGYSQSLGFSIVGGIDSTPGKQGIHVKSLVPGTPAFRDGRLKCGDIVLSVNGDDITNMTHAYVVQLLKNTKGLVTLDVVSWPGALV